jgi:hypothetical protein
MRTWPVAGMGAMSRPCRRWKLLARGLVTLLVEQRVHGGGDEPQDAALPHGLEPARVNQPPDGLRMHAETVRYLTDRVGPFLTPSR